MKPAYRHLIIAGLLGVAGIVSGKAHAQQLPQQDFVPGEIIIGFKSKQAFDDGMKDLKGLEKGGRMTTRSGTRSSSIKIEALDETSARITLDFKDAGGTTVRGAVARKTLEDFASDLRSDPRVEYAHPNWIMRLHRDVIGPPVYFDDKRFKPPLSPMSTSSGPNDPWFRRGLHWHYFAPPVGMNAIGAWPTTKGSKKVVVAVIDTGILPKHPDLKGSGNVLSGYDFITPARNDGDGQAGRDADPTDTGDQCPERGSGASWHGSHVAGTIGAAKTNNKRGIAGVNWSISVVPIRVLGRCGGTIVDLAAAIRWSAGLPVAGVPLNPNKADVINMSLGMERACTRRDFALLINAINAARRAGSTVVVAAGNESTDIKNVTPSGCKDVISVAASDRRGHLAPYSNFGAVTIMAPGGATNRDDDGDGMPDGVWSLVAPSGRRPSGIAAYQGTSMAAPHVAAAIAMAIGQKPELRGKPDAIRALLTESVAKRPNGACPKPCGPGLLDVKTMIAPVFATSVK